MRRIVELRVGSHLYGTATAGSDIDLKAVVLPSASDILLQRARPTVTEPRSRGERERNRPVLDSRWHWRSVRARQRDDHGAGPALGRGAGPGPALGQPASHDVPALLPGASGALWRQGRARRNRPASPGGADGGGGHAWRRCPSAGDRDRAGGAGRDHAACRPARSPGRWRTRHAPSRAMRTQGAVPCQPQIGARDARPAAGRVRRPRTAGRGRAGHRLEGAVARGPGRPGSDRAVADRPAGVPARRRAASARHQARPPVLYDSVAAGIERLLEQVEAATAASALPDHPDAGAAEALVLRAYRRQVLEQA